MAAARRHASARGSAYVEPTDLMAGLIADEDTGSFQLLVKYGPPLGALQERIGGVPHGEFENQSDLPLSSVARRAVARGREISLGRGGEMEVGTEDLLIALLDVWSEAEDLLESHGFAHDSIRAAHHAPDSGKLDVDTSESSLSLDFDAELLPRARLIDANLNRASEGFRVAEDYTRFVLQDRTLSERLKQARHRLQEAAGFLPESWRVTTRDVPNDVGLELSTELEGRRETMLGVAVANIKRVQEALRSLEEVSKIDNSLAARQFGAIRYEAYHLEKLFRTATAARQALASADVYWVAEPDACRKTFEWTANEVLDAGVVLVQLRQKGTDDRALLGMAQDLRRWTERYGARLVINDRADLARLVGADGVHVGQTDLPADAVRRVLGPDAIVGVSTHSLSDLERAVLQGADYVGVGPVFPSNTKSFDAFPGLDFVRAAVQSTSLPAFCIGGVATRNVDAVIEAGGRRVAVGRAISDSEEPGQVVRRLRTAIGAQ